MLALRCIALAGLAAGVGLCVAGCATAQPLPDDLVAAIADRAGRDSGATPVSTGAGGTPVGAGSSGSPVSGVGGTFASAGGKEGSVAGSGNGAMAGAGSGAEAGAGGIAGTGNGSGGATSAPAADAGSTANGSVLFTDDLEGGASKWTPLAPSDGWSVASDGTKVYRQGTLDAQFRVASAGRPAWTDQVIEARIKVLAFDGTSSSDLAAVYARFADADDHYYVALQGDGHLKLKKKTAGNNTSISSQASLTVSAGTWYTVKLQAAGTTLTAYVDGAKVLSATDADIASGAVAVGTKGATAEFDDVRVTAP